MRTCSKCAEQFDDNKKSSLCQDCRSKLGKRSKRKGAANELRFTKFLQKQFDKYSLPYRVRRTPRSGGIHEFEPSDVMFSGLPRSSVFKSIHFENKDTAQWAIESWFEEAVQKEIETGSLRNPVLIIRKPNSRAEYAVTDVEFLVKLLIEVDSLRKAIGVDK